MKLGLQSRYSQASFRMMQVWEKRAQARLTAQNVSMFLVSFSPRIEGKHRYTIATLSNSANVFSSSTSGLSQLSPEAKQPLHWHSWDQIKSAVYENSNKPQLLYSPLHCPDPTFPWFHSMFLISHEVTVSEFKGKSIWHFCYLIALQRNLEVQKRRLIRTTLPP